MRQPKYMMGEEVTYPEVFSSQDAGLSRILDVKGTIVGVRYNPKDASTGCPFYSYSIAPESSVKTVFIKEDLVKEE